MTVLVTIFWKDENYYFDCLKGSTSTTFLLNKNINISYCIFNKYEI